MYRRLDGTVMTRDCPKGLGYGWVQAKKLLRIAQGNAGLLALLGLPLLAVIIGIATLFGDNIKRLQAMSGQMADPRISVGAHETVRHR